MRIVCRDLREFTEDVQILVETYKTARIRTLHKYALQSNFPGQSSQCLYLTFVLGVRVIGKGRHVFLYIFYTHIIYYFSDHEVYKFFLKSHLINNQCISFSVFCLPSLRFFSDTRVLISFWPTFEGKKTIPQSQDIESYDRNFVVKLWESKQKHQTSKDTYPVSLEKNILNE